MELKKIPYEVSLSYIPRLGTSIENWHTCVRTEHLSRGYLCWYLNYFGPYIIKFNIYLIFLYHKFHKIAISTSYFIYFKSRNSIFSFVVLKWSSFVLYVCQVRKYNNMTKRLNNLKMSWLSGWGSYAKLTLEREN